jgi:aspartokinase/homoserine dehydrogenase 1
MERVAAILEDDPFPRLAVILSACRGVTDDLLRLVEAAERQDAQIAAAISSIRERHARIAGALLADADAREYLAEVDGDCRNVLGILNTVGLIQTASPVIRDIIAGFGELWSSRLFVRYITRRAKRAGPIRWLDARDIVKVERGPLGPNVQWPASRASLEATPLDDAATLIIPGFIARDEHGLQTTLGRNGSDFSASIFGALLDAEAIVIWTDVDGVLSADPRLVPDATIIDALSYEEAMELAYFGARVLHPQTMAPAVEQGIPIWIRNTFRPDARGTLICAEPLSNHPVKGISSIEGVALVNVEGAGRLACPAPPSDCLPRCASMAFR